MPRSAQEPQVVESNALGQMYAHPAFGSVSVSRIQGDANLFGSHIRHTGYVRLRVSRAELRKTVSSEDVFDRDTVVEVDLSEAQWAKLLSSMGSGGVPCTLNAAPDGRALLLPSIPNPPTPEERMSQQILDMIAESQAHADRAAADLIALVEPRLPKSAVTQFRRSLETLSGLSRSARNFHHDLLQETKEKAVHEAKIEIDAAAQRLVQALGLKSTHQLGQALNGSSESLGLLGPAVPDAD